MSYSRSDLTLCTAIGFLLRSESSVKMSEGWSYYYRFMSTLSAFMKMLEAIKKNMTEKIIQKYLDKLKKLRANKSELNNYKFKLSNDGKTDINQFNRYSIGVGFFNDLQIPMDYFLIKKLLKEEIKHRESQTENYEYETIYMYCYFLSEFGEIEDIWEYAKLKFDGSMDSYLGFDTGYFMTYGKEKLREYLMTSNHELCKKVKKCVGFDNMDKSHEIGKTYRESQISYFGFKKPINTPIQFYRNLNERKYFEIELKKWKNENNLAKLQTAFEYVNLAKFTGDESEIKKAMENYITIEPNDSSSEKYRKYLGIKEEHLIKRILNWIRENK